MRTFFVQLLFTAAVFILRLGMLPANISPVGSFGFHSKNLALLALVTIGFDYWYGGFYSSVLFTYAGFAGYVILGRLAGDSLRKQLTLLPVASFLFFAISNFGVWWYQYPHTLEGLMLCYTLALPFYTRTIIGDVGFGYSYSILRAAASQPYLRSVFCSLRARVLIKNTLAQTQV